jgi:lipopolysaccharide export system permease protein
VPVGIGEPKAGGRVDNQAVLQLVALTALTWLPFVLTLTLFIAVLMTLSRAYRDSEMVVWFATGQSLLAWVGPVLRFAWPIVIAIGLLSFFVTPWSQGQMEETRDRFAKRDDVSRVAPGRFIESSGSDRVFFVESVDVNDGEVRNVFVSAKTHGRETLVVAENGVIEVAPNGDRFIVLRQGRRYEGNPGQLEYRMLEFDRYAIRIESRPDQPIGERRAKTLPTFQLVTQPTPTHLGEMIWRISAPVMALLVTLLAIPLSYTNPRVGRSTNLIIAVLLFAVYINLLNTVQAYVQQERLSFGIGVWILHALVFAVVVLMFARRLFVHGWPLPRFLRRRREAAP